MHEPAVFPRIVRFGVFEADLHTRELRKNGLRIRLPDQPFQVLAMLLERPGEMVTREELRERLWPEGTFVDFEHSLNAAVKKLREALGDSADNPRFVETLARRGYRFIAPVQTEGPAAAPVRKRPGWAWAAGLAAIFAAAAGLAWIMLRERPAPELKAVPLTSLPGLELRPALSPDGRRIAFDWDGPQRDNVDVYVKEIGSEELSRLTTDAAPDYNAAWSPDGRHIAFLRQQGNGASVFVVPAGGGQERKLTEVGVWLPYPETLWLPDCDWSPDGRFLAVTDLNPDGKTWGIYLVSLETGHKHLLSTSDSPGVIDYNPAFSPDGEMVAFLRYGFAFAGEPVPLIQALSREGAQAAPARPMGRAAGLGSTVSWLPGGRELVVSPGSLVSVTGKQLRRFRLPARVPSMAQISLRGTTLVFTDAEAAVTLFRVSLAGAGRGQPARFLSSTRREWSPAFSPDGRRIAFSSWRSGEGLIWICNTDGSGCQQLSSFHGDGHAGSPSWSPDGRRVAFDVQTGGQWDIYISAVEGGALRRLTSNQANDARPRWSRDGQWIYFSSTRSGGLEIWKIRADSAGADAKAIRITREGGMEAAESADGRYLYYAKRGTPGIWRVPLGDSGATSEQKALDIGGEGFWSLCPDGIFVLDAGLGRSPAIRFFELAMGRLSEVATLPSNWTFPTSGEAFAVSPDRQWAVVTAEYLFESDLMLVENFR
jgi:Tol biopolymer transport system component/DNA-binding winged helix-turn-helix (wHTH) protein